MSLKAGFAEWIEEEQFWFSKSKSRSKKEDKRDRTHKKTACSGCSFQNQKRV
jgi:hypothetical protein